VSLSLPAKQLKLQLKLPNAFPKGIGRLPSNPLVQAYIEAICKGGERARQLHKRMDIEPGREPVVRSRQDPQQQPLSTDRGLRQRAAPC
jgi:hypothetical protein